MRTSVPSSIPLAAIYSVETVTGLDAERFFFQEHEKYCELLKTAIREMQTLFTGEEKPLEASSTGRDVKQ